MVTQFLIMMGIAFCILLLGTLITAVLFKIYHARIMAEIEAMPDEWRSVDEKQ